MLMSDQTEMQRPLGSAYSDLELDCHHKHSICVVTCCFFRRCDFTETDIYVERRGSDSGVQIHTSALHFGMKQW
jgi:hypothetical protein